MNSVNAIEVTKLHHPMDPLSLEFSLTRSNVEMANALRRTIISDVATLAIDIVTVQENNSVLPDEMIAHRLGLLPVDSSLADKMKLRQDCECQDVCWQCAAIFELNVSCDASYEGQTMLVTHMDVKPIIQQGQPGNAIQLVKPPGDMKIPIVKLRQGQSIRMKMTAYKGTGKLHAKWSSVSTVSFRYQPQIRLHPRVQDLDFTQKKSIEKLCHKQVFSVTTNKRDIDMFADHQDQAAEEDAELEVARMDACDFCGDCENAVIDFEMRGAIEVGHEDGTFYFVVESTGVLDPVEIVKRALQHLSRRFEVIRNECAGLQGVLKKVEPSGEYGGTGPAYGQFDSGGGVNYNDINGGLDLS